MGRKKEHREKLTCYVQKSTNRSIRRSIDRSDKELNTFGKVVDKLVKGKE